MSRPLGSKRKGEKRPPAWSLALALLDQLRARLQLKADAMPIIGDGTKRLFVYNGQFWEELTDERALALLYRAADNPQATTSRMRSEALANLKALCFREGHQWGRCADHEVPVANGVLNVNTKKLRPHRPEDYLEAVIPHPYIDGAPHPTLDDYLTTCFGENDHERANALKHFAGYVILPHARFKKALLLYGPSDSGKSQFVHLLKMLVGPSACTSLGVHEMDDPMQRAAIVGKLLNTLTELPSEAMIADGGFKALVSTEEPVQINPKFGTPFSYESRAKHVIATNTLPRVNDRTEATFRRLYVVPFTRVIPEEEQDPRLKAKFAAEMTGVLAWAVEGARSLVSTAGGFPPVELATSRIEELRAESNPVAQYVREVMIADGECNTPVAEVTRAFNAWSGGKRHDVRAVARMLRAAFGDEAVGKAHCKSIKVTAQALLGYRIPTDSELDMATGRQDWDRVES